MTPKTREFLTELSALLSKYDASLTFGRDDVHFGLYGHDECFAEVGGENVTLEPENCGTAVSAWSVEKTLRRKP